MQKFNQLKPELKFVEYQLPIHSDKQKIWAALTQFGNIASIHGNVVSSDYLGSDELKVGCERYCEFHPQMGRKPVVKERIIYLKNEESYLIDFFEFENFPMNHMYVELGVGESFGSGYLAYSKCWFQSRPKILTGLFAGKMKNTLREILLGYKHFVETGVKNEDIKKLKKLYPQM